MLTSAMVFAAGLGTRLQPLTNDRPKALVEINGHTLLETTLQKIIQSGITEIVVNVHHFSHLVKAFLATHAFDADIRISDESDFLRDTAGGLKYAEPLLHGDHILLHNVDILSDLDLRALVADHIDHQALATLAVRQRTTSRYLLFDAETLQLGGWQNVVTGEKQVARPMRQELPLGFSGIHVVSREILRHIPADQKLSMTPLYLTLAPDHLIRGYRHDSGRWMDVGKYNDVVKLRENGGKF